MMAHRAVRRPNVVAISPFAQLGPGIERQPSISAPVSTKRKAAPEGGDKPPTPEKKAKVDPGSTCASADAAQPHAHARGASRPSERSEQSVSSAPGVSVPVSASAVPVPVPVAVTKVPQIQRSESKRFFSCVSHVHSGIGSGSANGAAGLNRAPLLPALVKPDASQLPDVAVAVDAVDAAFPAPAMPAHVQDRHAMVSDMEKGGDTEKPRKTVEIPDPPLLKRVASRSLSLAPVTVTPTDTEREKAEAERVPTATTQSQPLPLTLPAPPSRSRAASLTSSSAHSTVAGSGSGSGVGCAAAPVVDGKVDTTPATAQASVSARPAVAMAMAEKPAQTAKAGKAAKAAKAGQSDKTGQGKKEKKAPSPGAGPGRRSKAKAAAEAKAKAASGVFYGLTLLIVGGGRDLPAARVKILEQSVTARGVCVYVSVCGCGCVFRVRACVCAFVFSVSLWLCLFLPLCQSSVVFIGLCLFFVRSGGVVTKLFAPSAGITHVVASEQCSRDLLVHLVPAKFLEVATSFLCYVRFCLCLSLSLSSLCLHTHKHDRRTVRYGQNGLSIRSRKTGFVTLFPIA